MQVHFESGVDQLIVEDTAEQYRVYRKCLHQPVYAVEPTDAQPRATILFLHGLCEHAYRHFPLGVEWATHGYQTLLINLAGHGVIPADEEKVRWLIKCYAEGTEPARMVDIIRSRPQTSLAYAQQIRAYNYRLLCGTRMADHDIQIDTIIRELALPLGQGKTPVPFFLGGHSLGGLLATEACRRLARYGSAIPDGVILVNPAFRPLPPPSASQLERGVMSLSLAAKSNRLLRPAGWVLNTFARLDFRVETTWSSEWISDIPPENELHRVDPLILRSVPSGYLTAIAERMAATVKHAAAFPAPVIAFVAQRDRVVDSGGATAFNRALCSGAEEIDHRIKSFSASASHDLSRSSERATVLQELYEWLDARCEGPSPDQPEH
jgi:alpha-beta hydrolase superfamily lysophospholipase